MIKYSLRENLEVTVNGHGQPSQWVQCSRCGTMLTHSPAEWRKAARIRMLPATAASPLMAILDDRYRLEQVLCPSCGALFDTELVESIDLPNGSPGK
jgi:ribosomal protein S27AE